MRHMYCHICLICAHDLIGTFCLYVAFEEHISFGHMYGNNMSPVT